MSTPSPADLAPQIYDLSEFKEDHPGGAKVIMLYAGRDASQEFRMLHPPTLVSFLCLEMNTAASVLTPFKPFSHWSERAEIRRCGDIDRDSERLQAHRFNVAGSVQQEMAGTVEIEHQVYMISK